MTTPVSANLTGTLTGATHQGALTPIALAFFLDAQTGHFQGSAQGGINQSFAPNTLVSIAPYKEQKRIIKKLDKLLAKVNSAQERLDKIPTIPLTINRVTA